MSAKRDAAQLAGRRTEREAIRRLILARDWNAGTREQAIGGHICASFILGILRARDDIDRGTP